MDTRLLAYVFGYLMLVAAPIVMLVMIARAVLPALP